MVNVASAERHGSAVQPAKAAVRARVLDGFDDASFGAPAWDRLACRSNLVYLTWQWQRSWWETFGKGQLLLIVAERDGEPLALAPFYCRSGIVFFVGAAHWQADRLDFVGDISQPEVLYEILSTARNAAANFRGFRFEFVPGDSQTAEFLKLVADRLSLSCHQEWKLEGATIDLSDGREKAEAAANRKSLRKCERAFEQSGALEIQHVCDGGEIGKHLDEMFSMHVERWRSTPQPSLFEREQQREFYKRLTELAANVGWLRFSRLVWQGRPVAYHYGFCYQGRYFWNVSTFAKDVANLSPGKVLLRHLVLGAIDEGAESFDFGSGDQSFKLRWATDVPYVYAWGMYPSRGRQRVAS